MYTYRIIGMVDNDGRANEISYANEKKALGSPILRCPCEGPVPIPKPGK